MIEHIILGAVSSSQQKINGSRPWSYERNEKEQNSFGARGWPVKVLPEPLQSRSRTKFEEVGNPRDISTGGAYRILGDHGIGCSYTLPVVGLGDTKARYSIFHPGKLPLKRKSRATRLVLKICWQIITRDNATKTGHATSSGKHASILVKHFTQIFFETLSPAISSLILCQA